jgi:hypothetical protein
MVLSIFFLATACQTLAKLSNGGEDNTYLTPIPQTTLNAFKWEGPIENKLKAVIAARKTLGETRLQFTVDPKVLSVEELNLAEARKRLTRPGDYIYEDRPGNTKVWLVIFSGEYLIVPPDPLHTFTPGPPGPGCAYAMIDAQESWRSSAGTIDCPP